MKLKTRIKRFFGLNRSSEAFDDPEFARLAAEKSAVIRKMRQQVKLREMEAELVDLENRLNPPQQEAQQAQEDPMQQIMGLFMMMQAFSGKQPGEASPDDMAQFMATIQENWANPSQNLNTQVGVSSPQRQLRHEASEIGLSDEEIRANINTIPKAKVKFAKNLTPNVLKNYMKKNFDYDDKTISRAVEILKTEF